MTLLHEALVRLYFLLFAKNENENSNTQLKRLHEEAFFTPTYTHSYRPISCFDLSIKQTLSSHTSLVV